MRRRRPRATGGCRRPLSRRDVGVLRSISAGAAPTTPGPPLPETVGQPQLGGPVEDLSALHRVAPSASRTSAQVAGTCAAALSSLLGAGRWNCCARARYSPLDGRRRHLTAVGGATTAVSNRVVADGVDRGYRAREFRSERSTPASMRSRTSAVVPTFGGWRSPRGWRHR